MKKPKSTSIFVNYWMPVIAWASIIFYLSSIPNLNSGLGTVDFILRKIAHMTEFGILAFLSWRAINQHLTKNVLISSYLFSALYAASDELHQSFVPLRKSSPVDIFIDICGITIAALVIKAHSKRQRTPVNR